MFYIRLIAIACLAGLAGTAHADTFIIFQNNYGEHSFGFNFVSSTPYNYERLSASPEEVSLTFNQPLDEEKSSIEVSDMFGRQLNEGKLVVEDKVMRTRLPHLPAGRYKVKWKVQCRCPDQTRLNDTFRFIVK